MIHFKKVSYQNFLSTGNKATVIQLDKNKNTLIVGKNGAGKSTVLEAISVGLYGKTMRNINKPQQVNTMTGKGMMIEIEFAIGVKNYLVRRGIKPTVFEIFMDGKLIDQDSASRDYQEILENQILKLNHKSFSQVVVLSIANYVPFMRLPAAGRREVIEDLLNIQIFSLMNVLLKQKIADNKSDLTKNDYDIRLIENKIEMHKKHIEEINQNTEEMIAQRRLNIQAHQSDNNICQQNIETLQSDLAIHRAAAAEKDGIGEQLTATFTLHKAVLDKCKKIEKEIAFYLANTTCPTCKQQIEETYKLTEVEKKNTTLAEACNAVTKLDDKISRLRASMAEYQRTQKIISELNSEITAHNNKIITNRQIIEAIEQEIVALASHTVTDDSTSHALNDELMAATRRKETLIREREIFLMGAQLLKDGGIKTRIIKQYIPIMNKLINKYLAQMDFFVQFELDETFKETIKSRFRDEFTYDSFSQGEKLRIDLALLFCWRSIAKLRNSASTNLLFMDEILDSSLDSYGVDEFLKIIGDLTNDTNCFIISHRGDQMIDKFENVIRFRKVKNFSQIEKT